LSSIARCAPNIASYADLLAAGSTAEGKRSKKKKRKSVATADASVDADAAEDPLYVEHDWRLRLKVGSCIARHFAAQLAPFCFIAESSLLHLTPLPYYVIDK
jgi:hypothetical protein